LNPKTSPAAIVVAQPVSAEFWLSCALDKVTGADAEILFALVGIAPFAFQMSTVIEPDLSDAIVTLLIVHAKLTLGKSFSVPVAMGEPLPSITKLI
jgi:hypothetical protein